MNEKIVEKLKDAKFLEQIIVMSDENEVKEAFKKEGLEITDEDLKCIRDLIEDSVDAISKVPEEKLEEISGGLYDGVVNEISNKLYFASDVDSFVDKHSDMITEAGLAAILIAGSVGGTIGIQKLIKVGKEKGWWTKEYWKKNISKD